MIDYKMRLARLEAYRKILRTDRDQLQEKLTELSATILKLNQQWVQALIDHQKEDTDDN